MYICDQYFLVTWNATSEQNQLVALDLNSISAVHGFGSWIALTEIIRVGALGLSPICAEYGRETEFSQLREFVFWLSTFNLSVVKMGTKPNSLLTMKFEYLNSTYSLSLLNIGSKHDSLHAKKLIITSSFGSRKSCFEPTNCTDMTYVDRKYTNFYVLCESNFGNICGTGML